MQITRLRAIALSLVVAACSSSDTTPQRLTGAGVPGAGNSRRDTAVRSDVYARRDAG